MATKEINTKKSDVLLERTSNRLKVSREQLEIIIGYILRIYQPKKEQLIDFLWNEDLDFELVFIHRTLQQYYEGNLYLHCNQCDYLKKKINELHNTLGTNLIKLRSQYE